MLTLGASIAIAGAGGLAGLWSYHTKWVDIRQVSLGSTQLTTALTVVHLSDLHGSLRWVNGRLSKLVRRLEPDLVCLTGDLATRQAQLSRVMNELALIAARCPIYFVPGNYEREQQRRLFFKESIVLPPALSAPGSPVQMLLNDGEVLQCKGNRLLIYGFDNSIYGNERTSPSFLTADPIYRLVLAHSPSIIHYIEERSLPIDLLLTGHTHGGQVRLHNRTWGAYRHYHCGVREYASGQFFGINRGLGTVKLPLRWNCRPEITVYHLKPR
ncbi:metallophosphoesterase [Paenibacillus senegalensis]|uniref:metallophosphoesterase n=1 Tax=Paenibacillus senegalensis TaxID=1465766 RepID=UPI00028930F9|nr:metallophosphoesterase [Paenibacillus senegalensis]